VVNTLRGNHNKCSYTAFLSQSGGRRINFFLAIKPITAKFGSFFEIAHPRPILILLAKTPFKAILTATWNVTGLLYDVHTFPSIF
jgi:hypothetical protein